jgi:glyoxylase I family protein
VTRRLHHLALGAHDVDGVAGFYRDVLGVAELTRHLDETGELRSVWLDLGEGALLMVERSAEPLRRVAAIGAGPFLIAFEVGADEQAELERALEAAGAAIEGRTEYTSYARDPEGNRVAISRFRR